MGVPPGTRDRATPVTVLAEKLAARIRATGPLTFAQYMEAALYDDEHGYYTTRARIGFDGDYLTASDLGPAFGRLLGAAVSQLWGALGEPAEWDLIEAGAGKGITLRDLVSGLRSAAAPAAAGARPAIVEVSPRLQRTQASALAGLDVRWARSPAALAPVRGVVFANELLDAFPVHVLVRTAEGPREAHVGERGGRLEELLLPIRDPELAARIPAGLPLGGRWEVSLAAEAWIAALAGSLARGYLLLIDYGDTQDGLLARQGAGTVRAFARHRLLEDVLAAPGEHDLTATVNFTAIGRAAERAGLRPAGLGRQRDVFDVLERGPGAADGSRRDPRPAPDGSRADAGSPADPARRVAGDDRAAAALAQLRDASARATRAALVDPGGFGAFMVACYAKGAPTEGLRMFARTRT